MQDNERIEFRNLKTSDIYEVKKHINSLEDSWITMYPRRSVEALTRPVYFGEPSEEFPLERVSALKNLQEQIFEIVEWERDIIESGA